MLSFTILNVNFLNNVSFLHFSTSLSLESHAKLHRIPLM